MMDQEQLIYRIYRITNRVDDKIYIGSTRRLLRQRFDGHKYDARDEKCQKSISQYMRTHGIDNFTIELIEQITVTSRKEARIREQTEIDKIEKDKCLNKLRAYSENREKTRDQDKKRAVRRAFYHAHKQDPEWIEKERERNKQRMRLKRLNQEK